jgi:membrane associated rhomboid family serine protease
MLISLFFWLDSRMDLRAGGILDSALMAKGQWWRLFTAVWLHADISHLATNATFGFILLGLALGRFGTGTGLLAAYLAGAVGNLCPWLIGLGAHRSLGASGMVMGALGLLAAQSLALGRNAPPAFRVASVLAGTMLFALLGLSPGTDVLAHLGGFAGGLVLGAVLVRFPASAGGTKVNLLCGLAFTCLVLLPWWLAFRRG